MTIEKLTQKELEAIRHIRNSIMHKGRIPSMRELMISMGYRSPRSSALIIGSLIKKGVFERRKDGKLIFIRTLDDDRTRTQTVNVPLVGSVACGMPIFAEENIDAMIPVSTQLARPPYKYFLLKAKGDSMNEKGINDGDLVLVRQQMTSEDGDIIVALIDDEATIKEIHYSNDVIVLKPRSTNKQHKPIVLSRDFLVQGIVVTSISNL